MNDGLTAGITTFASSSSSLSRMIKSLAVLPLVFVLVGLDVKSASAQTDPDYQIEVEDNTLCSFINGDDVRVRQGPDSSAPIVAQLNRGDGVRAVGRIGDWVEIVALDSGIPPEPYSPLEGFVSNQYINGCAEHQFDMWRQ